MTYTTPTYFADVNINHFADKGNGTGGFTLNEQTSEAEISFAIPGDIIHSALEKKRGKWIGQIEEIIQPSSARISPRCEHFGICGGCRWQQMTYGDQLTHKESLIRNTFDSLMTPETQFHPIIGCFSEWHYRNKMDFTFSSDLNRNKYLGLIMDSRRGKVMNLSECHLASQWFINTVNAVRYWWEESNIEAYHMRRNTGVLRTLTLREGVKTKDHMVILTVSEAANSALHKHDLENFVAAVRQASDPFEGKLSIFLRILQIGTGIPTNFYEICLYGEKYIQEQLDLRVDSQKSPIELKFMISPSVFFQPNTLQAENFLSTALKMAKIDANTVVYDLFCGVGTFGICASKIAKEVIGIEISSEAVDNARKNIVLNDCKNITIFTGAVRHVITHAKERKIPPPDVIFVDPPRCLDPKALSQLKLLNSPKILYLSSSPKKQVEEIKDFLECGYELSAIQPFDQFPHTPLVDNLVLLTKAH